VEAEATPGAHDAQSFKLRGRVGPVVLDADGVHHPLTARGGRTFTRYQDLLHLTLSQRALWLGARKTVAVLPRKAFVDPDAPEALARALIERISARPGSRAQLARMADIEDRARACPPSRATWGLAALCVVVYALQILLGHDVYDVGHMSPALVADGDAWRLVTANLLHAESWIPAHLILNLIALIAFGTLCERPLGTARTLAVMGVSGLASMTASAWVGYSEVVGVSGVVSGLLGAVTWLEVFRTDELPAWWRVPRRALFAMLVLTAVLGVLVPMIAGAAHIGGFAAGVVCAMLLADRPLSSGAAPAAVRALAAVVVLATVAGVAASGAQLLAPGDYAAKHLARLGQLPNIRPDELNNRAWLVALDENSSPELLQAARVLAERAVRETLRKEPTILDTLADLQFQTGEPEAAVATIEEAMSLDPDEPYYGEQRRRFLGERSDRPPPPGPFQRIIPVAPSKDPGVTV
jgi:membrane associated rhomboid family serine protease